MGTQGEFFEKPEALLPVIEESSTTVAPEPSVRTAIVSSAPRESKRGMKDLSIPKLYYSISEVSRLTGLEQYVLRYWETEFEELRPQKNRAGNRIYSNKDIKFILKIKELLREKRYTIEGAKHILKEERTSDRERSTAEETKAEDPSQIQMPAEAIGEPKAELSNGHAASVHTDRSQPAAVLTLEEIQEMKNALLSLKAVLGKRS